MRQAELFEDGMCPVCSIWFCTDEACKKKIKRSENWRTKYSIRYDRREYFRQRYAENRDEMLAAQNARNAARRKFAK